MSMRQGKPSSPSPPRPAPGRTAGRGRLRPPRILLYLDAVARLGSIRKAAEHLNIASSALNRRILDLEDEIGSPLFERLPRGVRLTAAGEAFMGYVRRSLSDLDMVSSQIELLHGLVRGAVRIAAAESAAADLLAAVIAPFQVEHPRVCFHVKVGGPKELLAALLDDGVDLIVTHEPPQRRDITILAEANPRLCAFVAAGHPLAGREALRLRDCLDYPVALADESLAVRGFVDQAVAKASFQFEPSLTSNSVEALRAFVRVSQAVCLLFPGEIRAAAASGIVAIPLRDPLLPRGQLLLAVRRERVLPVAAAAFAERLRSVFAQISKADG